MEVTLFSELGRDNLALLVDRFYELVFANDQIAHFFKTDKYAIKEKQLLFLTQFFGGEPLYTQRYGHPQLRARHLPHVITRDDAVAWLSCMTQAVHSLGIPEALKEEIMKRLIPTAMFMVNTDG